MFFVGAVRRCFVLVGVLEFLRSDLSYAKWMTCVLCMGLAECLANDGCDRGVTVLKLVTLGLGRIRLIFQKMNRVYNGGLVFLAR